MKKYIFIPSLLLLTSLLLPSKLLAAEMINGIAAVVNGDIITIRQLKTNLAEVREQLTSQKTPIPAPDIFTNQVLQMMVDEKLEEQTAKRLNLSITDDDIRKMVQQIAKQQNMNAKELQISLQQRGISETVFINQVKRQLLNDKLLRAIIAPQITVSDDEINAGMKIASSQAGQEKEYHLSHISVSLPPAPSPEQISAAKEKANRIVAELQTGANFDTISAAESDGSNMLSGGDLGWKSLAELAPDYADQIATAKAGDIIGPLQSPGGFEIIKIEDVRGKNISIDKSALRQQVAQMIFQRKLQEQQQLWLEQLRAGAYIKIFYTAKTLPKPLS